MSLRFGSGWLAIYFLICSAIDAQPGQVKCYEKACPERRPRRRVEEAWPFSGRWLGTLNGFYRFLDHLDHDLRLRQHHYVAARGLGRGGAHAFGKKALQVRRYGVVVFGDDVPVRLRLPGGSAGFCVKQVGFRNALRGPNEFLLLLRKVSAEILRALRTQPDTSV